MNERTHIRFEEWEAEQMQDPEFRAAVEELEPAYQMARLRIMRGLTQKELAERVGTKQSSIARLESGKTEPRLSFLRRVAKALQGEVRVRIVPEEEQLLAVQPPRNVVVYSYVFVGESISGTAQFESPATGQSFSTWTLPREEGVVQ